MRATLIKIGDVRLLVPESDYILPGGFETHADEIVSAHQAYLDFLSEPLESQMQDGGLELSDELKSLKQEAGVIGVPFDLRGVDQYIAANDVEIAASLSIDSPLPMPSASDVRAFLESHGLTGANAAKAMYLSGARQVRKYTGGTNPRQIDLARWFTLHAKVMLPSETIAEIEAAMRGSAR